MKNPLSYKVYRVLALAWMGLIFYFSSRSKLPTPALFWGQDKLAHAVAFGILAFLFAQSLRIEKGRYSFKHVLVIALLVAVYGAFDEFHQRFVPGRDASVFDLVADILGGFVTALLLMKSPGRHTGSRLRFS